MRRASRVCPPSRWAPTPELGSGSVFVETEKCLAAQRLAGLRMLGQQTHRFLVHQRAEADKPQEAAELRRVQFFAQPFAHKHCVAFAAFRLLSTHSKCAGGNIGSGN